LTPLMVVLGWRASFAVLGGTGVLVAVAWGLIYRDAAAPKNHAPSVAGPVQWLLLLRQRTVWGLLLGFAGTVYITWLYVTWLPGYLHDRWDMSPTQAGLWSAVPQLFGFFGAIGGGWLSDRLTAITSERAARQWPLAIGLSISVQLGPTISVQTGPVPAVALDGHARFLMRQLSLPVSMMSQ
jgi:nitrate/nitrite transporter NarK